MRYQKNKMKHLTGYKVFESFSEEKFKEDILDIFQSEVNDSSFTIQEDDLTSQVGFQIRKPRRSVLGTIFQNFDITELQDFIERVLTYSDQNSLDIKIYPIGSFQFNYVTMDNIGQFHDIQITGLMITKSK